LLLVLLLLLVLQLLVVVLLLLLHLLLLLSVDGAGVPRQATPVTGAERVHVPTTTTTTTSAAAAAALEKGPRPGPAIALRQLRGRRPQAVVDRVPAAALAPPPPAGLPTAEAAATAGRHLHFLPHHGRQL